MSTLLSDNLCLNTTEKNLEYVVVVVVVVFVVKCSCYKHPDIIGWTFQRIKAHLEVSLFRLLLSFVVCYSYTEIPPQRLEDLAEEAPLACSRAC